MRKFYFLFLLCFVFTASQAQLTGTKTIPGDYATITAAVTALNAQGVGAGGVTFNVAGGYTETIAATISLTATGTVANPIVFQKSGAGANPLITAYTGGTGTPGTAVQDGIFRLVGSDYVTIDGINLTDNAANAANPATMEYGYALYKASATDGCQNNTIKNCTITLNTINNASGTAPMVDGSVGINVMNATAIAANAVLTVTSAAGANSNNKFYTNTIKNCNIGIAIIGFADATPFANADAGNDIGGTSIATGNSILNYGGVAAATNPAAAVRTLAQYGVNVSYNTINNNDGAGANHVSTLRGIYLNTATSASATISFNTITIKGGGTTSAITAIENQSGATAASNTISINNNTVTGCTYTTATSGTFTGILNAASAATVNINSNQFTANATNATSGTTTMISNTGAATVAVNINSNNINGMTYNAVTSGAFVGIVSSGAGAASSLSISSNNFQAITYSALSTAANTYINCTAIPLNFTANLNTFTNLNINTSGTTNFILMTYTTANAASTKTVTNNSIVTGFTRGGASGGTLFLSDNGSSVTGTVTTVQNNNFSNMTVAGTATIIGINLTDGGTAPTKNITGNTFNNWTAVTGALNVINITYWNGVSVLSNNTITNITGQAAVTGITMAATVNTATSINVASNTITGLSSTGTGGSVTGITCTNTSPIINISSNTIGALSSTGASAVTGISIGGATNTSVFRNKIYDIAGSNASSTVNGILISAGTLVSVYNNIIGDLRAAIANAANPVIGLSITGGTTVNAYYNTIYLNATSSGALFGSSAVSASSTPTVTLRNNIFVNTSTAVGATGFTVAYRRSSTTIGTYATTSNNNLFYAGVPSASNLIFYDGTNSDQTASAFKTRVTPADALSGTENPSFLSTTGSVATFLHISPSIASIVESGGVNITGITNDFNGDTRQGNTGYSGTGTAPDLGADEIAGTALVLAPPTTFASNTPTPSSFNITWTDNSVGEQGFNVFRSLNVGGPFTFVAAVSSTTSATTGTTYSLPQTGLLGNTTYYYQVFSNNGISSVALTGSASTAACGSGITGTKTIPGDYASITAAITALQTNGMGGAVVLELQPSYTGAGETYPLTFGNTIGCLSPANPLTLRPAASVVTGLTITSANATATIDLNGSNSVTIDGRSGGTGTASKLSIINTATAGVAIRIINDANSNTITYCDVQGANTQTLPTITTAGGAIFINSANATNLQGNDNNTISNCSVHPASGAALTIAIAAFGTATTSNSYNENCTIINCNIYDFFSAASASTGIKIDAGNGNWTITNNKFYQTAPLTYTGTQTNRVLWVTPNTTSLTLGSGFVITGNFIGGSDANGNGTYTTTGTTAHLFTGMDLSVGLGTATSVQNNTITNFNATTASASSQAFIGINIANGNVNVGTTTGNTIGSTTTNGAITFTTTGSLGGVMGFRSGGGGTLNFSNNIVSGIDLSGNALLVAPSFNGIAASGGTSITVNNNVIGNATMPNSINILTTSATSTTAVGWRGIIVNGGTASTVTNNLVANMNSNFIGATGTTAATLVGISVTLGTSTVTGNTIRNLSSSSQTANGGGTATINGIAFTSTTAPATISGNTIHTLSLTNASATSAMQNAALFYTGPTTGANVIEKNNIHSLSILSSNNTAAYLTGMDIGSGTVTVKNNMIRLGIDENGNDVIAPCVVRGITKNTSIINLWNNSIYIGGNNVGTSTTNTFAFARTAAAVTDSIKNNIFANERSNASTGGKHYQVNLSGSATLEMDYNVYYGTGNGNVFGVIGTTDYASYASNWVAGDIHSYSSDPKFIAPLGTSTSVNLHISPSLPTIVEANGIAITGLTDDYDGQTRSGLTPTDIGADAGNFTSLTCTGTPVAGSATANITDICGGATVTLLLSGYSNVPGLTFQWKVASVSGGPYADVVGGTGATTSSYTSGPLTGNSYFVCVVKCTGSGLSATSTQQLITVNNPAITGTTPGSRCGIGTVSLAATAPPGSTLNWYAASSGGASLATGSPFVTPSISATTPYYVSASAGGSTVFAGRLVPQAPGATNLTTYGLDFTVTQAFTLNSVDVVSTDGTSITVSLYSAGGATQLQTTGPVTVPINATTAVPLNWAIAPGTYRLFVPAMTGNFIRENSLVTYPITLSTVGQINGFVSALTGAVTTTASYYFLYNWSITTGCESARTLVNATINTPPTITKSATPASICAGQTSVLATSSTNAGYTYTWTPGSLAGASVNVTPSSTTKYYVDAVDNTTGTFQGCTNRDSVTVTVNPVPDAVTVTPSAASLCHTTNPAVLLTAGGGSIVGSMNFGTQAAQNAASTTITGYPGPYSVYYGGQRMQILILASELSASGFAAGSNLTNIGFPVVSLGTRWGSALTDCQNFQVNMGNTTSSTISAFQTTGMTQVLAPTSFTPVVGAASLNTLTFTTPFTWDGTSNVIVETTFSNNITGQAGDEVIHYNSPTSFQSCIVYRVDAVAAATVATTTTVTYSYSARPDFTLNGSKLATFTWSPLTQLYTDAAATTAYTGTAATAVYAKPTATRTYTATATIGTCTNTKNVVVTSTCPVPVTLVNFRGNKQGSINNLSWTTETEMNNAGFELERSADGSNFSSMAFVASKAANGTSNATLNYSFSDTKPFTGNSYYRLKQIDKDGKSTYSQVVLLKGSKLAQIDITAIYPNPVSNVLSLVVTSPATDKVTIVVTDIAGKILLQKVAGLTGGDNTMQLNVSNLASGTYLIKATCQNGCESNAKKFVKD